MTFRHYLLNSKNFNRYPYGERISCTGEDKVDFIYQYIWHCSVKDSRICTKDIIGKPTKFPNYGNLTERFTMKTDGPEVSISPWQDRWNSIKDTNDYIYLETAFAEAVYPIRVSIYEVYNPGYITEIWAHSCENYDWFLLWKGSHQIVPRTSRLFSPPLQTCNFKTKHLKLKFEHDRLNNYTIIDAVMLIGSSELILPKNSKQNLTDLLRRINCINMYSLWGWRRYGANVIANYDNAHLDIDHLQKYFTEYCTIYKKDINKTDYQIHKEIPQKVIFDYEVQRCLKCLPLSANKSQELSYFNLSALPDEVILDILKNLDLLMLCRISQVNKRFNDLSRDPSLYTYLYLRNICIVNKRTFDLFYYFTSRCKYLKRLDLTCCNFSVSGFIQFLKNCGKNLTHLRLIKCQPVNNFVLYKISKICKNLKVLDLTSYQYGFSYLENLENLEYLNLSKTCINIEGSKELCKRLERVKGMRELNLKHSFVQNLTAIVTVLRNSCQDLEIINLDDTSDVTSEDIDVLSGCTNLRKINLHIGDLITNDSLYKLFSSCQRLEEVHLSSHLSRLNYCDFKFLMCKNLIKLCLHINEIVPFDSTVIQKYFSIFEQCPKLQEFHVDHYITYKLIDQWKLQYPNVSVSTRYFCVQ